MTALISTSFALRSARGARRQKQVSLSRPHAASHSLMALDAASGAFPECVFKRFPAIGDTPSLNKQRG
jgi:hypothetical protein